MNAADVPLVIAVAPNGAYKHAADHPGLPISPAELAATAAACLAEGAAMLHLHVRGEDGGHSLDAGAYRAALEAVSDAVGDRLLVQVTTESGGRFRPPEQMAVVRELRPECVSLAIRELAPDAASEPVAGEFFAWLCAQGIIPQFILYSRADLQRYQALRGRGVVPDQPFPLLFVLGRYTAGQASGPEELLPFLDELAHPAPWMVCAFGRAEHRCATVAAGLGGHVRIGFENNLLLRDGSVAHSNADLVRQAREAADVLARPLADATAARALFSNPKSHPAG